MRRATRPSRLVVLVVVLVTVGGMLALGAFREFAAPDLDRVPPPPAAGRVPPPLAEAPTCQRATVAAPSPVVRARVPDGVRVTSGQILGCPQAFDRVDLTYAGEVVGDLLDRGVAHYVLANDDAYALHLGPLAAHGLMRGANTGLTLRLTAAQAEMVNWLGRPGQRGDLVLVTGRLWRSEPGSGTGPVLRVDTLEVMSAGGPVPTPLNVPVIVLASSLVALAAGLAGLRRRAGR